METKPVVVGRWSFPIYTGNQSKALTKIKMGMELSDDDKYTIVKDVCKEFKDPDVDDPEVIRYINSKYPELELSQLKLMIEKYK